MEKKLDRRVVRTRKLLRDALMALILENGYEAVTVRAITERANLGRATFYLHYRDKEELLLKSLETVFDELVATMGPPAPEKELNGAPIYLVFTHAAQNSDLYRVILSGQGSLQIQRQVRDYIAREVTRRLLPLLPAERPFPDDLLSQFLAGSMLSLLGWWLEEGMPYPPTQMADSYHTLMHSGLGNLLGIDRNQIML